jgi:hypothetical protein
VTLHNSLRKKQGCFQHHVLISQESVVKILGQDTNPIYTMAITLPRPDGSEWILNVSPLPLGFHCRLMSRGMTTPVPPKKVTRDSQGRPIKDRSGLAVLMQDDHDPIYVAELARYQQMLAALMVYEGLKHDSTITFDAQPPESGSWELFAEELCAEFESAGWSLGDVTRVCEEICRVSNLLDDHLQDAEQNFSSPARDAATL